MKFTFLKKQKEKINIKIPEGPQPSVSKARDEDIYFERVDYQEEEYDFGDLPDVASKIKKINETLAQFEKKYHKTLHRHQFLKLFGRAALKNKDFNQLTLKLDKEINRFKKYYDETKKKADIMKHLREVSEGEPETVFQRIGALFDQCKNLNKELTAYQYAYFPRLKIASYSLCNDMTHTEIENLTKAVNKTLEEFKNIQEAYDYILYNSGDLIIRAVDAFVQGLQNSNNPKYKEYSRKYFLSSDFVMVMSFSEWVDLFTKLLYIKRIAKDIELFDYLHFKNHYQELEKRYAIMLIYNEMNRK